jgi:hypothetical protein
MVAKSKCDVEFASTSYAFDGMDMNKTLRCNETISRLSLNECECK